jgi:hypothetical protein
LYIHETILTLLRDIQKEGRGLAGDIDNTLSGIKVHQRFTNEIDSARDVLNTIVAQSQGLLPDANLLQDMETFKGLEDRYTMESERTIHTAHVPHTPGKKTEQTPTHKEELGDNFELF